jgi:hypothetical protein
MCHVRPLPYTDITLEKFLTCLRRAHWVTAIDWGLKSTKNETWFGGSGCLVVDFKPVGTRINQFPAVYRYRTVPLVQLVQYGTLARSFKTEAGSLKP